MCFLKIKLLNPNCRPHRTHSTDSGLDLRASIDRKIVLMPHETVTIPTGIAIELPKGYEGQIRPRSSFSKAGILSPLGTIDNGYRGEVKVILINTSDLRPCIIKPYERIAQLVIAPVTIPTIEYVGVLEEAERGDNGFGSTGRI